MIARAGLVLVLLLATACGFHLRGDLALPPEMDRTWLEYSGSDIGIRQEIARQLSMSGGGLVSDPEAASAVLHVLGSRVSTQVTAKDRMGRPQEYLLTVELDYRVVLEDGEELVSGSVSREKSLALDATDPLGSRSAVDQEAARMREESVWQMLNRIAGAARPEAAETGAQD